MKQIATPILKINHNFELITWNPSAEEFLKENLNKQLKIGLSIDQVFPQKLLENFKSDFKKNEGAFYNAFSFSATKDIELSSSPCLDAKANIDGFSICLKLTSKKESSSSENIIQLRNILENSSLAIFLTDPAGPILDVNKAACRMFGYTFEELIGLGREDIIQKNIDLEKAVKQRNEAGEIRRELTGIKKNGETFPCEVHSVIFTTHKGEKRTSTTIVDISDRKNQELIAENSKQAFQSLFDYNPDAVYSFDLEGNFLSLNNGATKLSEASREELLDMTFLPLIPAEDRARVMAHFTKAASGEIQHYQTNFESLKGTKKVLDVTNFPIYVNGKITGVYGIAKDITQQLNIKQKLREERNMFRAIIDYIPDRIFVVNEKHETILTNHSFYKNYIGVENEQKSLGLTPADYFPKEEAEGIIQDNARVMNQGIPVINRGDIVKNFNGDQEYTLLTKVPVKFGDNKKGLVGISRNITEIKEKEKALEDLNNQLRKHAEELALSNKELEQFAYIASHDLQEPLRMVTSFLSQLKKKYNHKLDEKAQQYIYFAHDGATRMRQIILDLLEYSRVGRLEHTVTVVNIEDLVSEVLSLQKKCIEEKKAEIIIDQLPTLKVEEPLLRQLFSNLIGNALKYYSKDRPPKIKVSALEKDKYWEFRISDNGIGIEKEFTEKIFVIFQRLHQREEYEGTGIGLAICKKIVENFGGEIWVDSEYGKGSSFYFTIPKQF
ncbi:PAS domain S-box protein [Salegentibacter sp. JZCK2]|uniref:PAS domain-containing sensor histidine kinase n=1 Tax=Salegentibacter tibetensis TaxID=2873600 RepID=UPI001CCBC52C|nr:PAS domain-containing sensor histidine kinase [Salegentibacter tibetensis]MBZ9731001.1 PAS domain S-box protein [Salegentibacter tibetensis]